jgi:hypothetical protein
MDPEATLAIVNDEAATSDERDFAALDLLVWLAKGGVLPPMEGLRPKADLIERCESRVIGAIEGYEER